MPVFGGGGSGGSGGLVRLKTVTNGSTAALDTGAASIPAGHGSLYIVAYARSAVAGATEAYTLRFNGDSGGNYDFSGVQGSNSAVTSTPGVAQTAVTPSGLIVGNTALANYASAIVLEIPLYDNTTWFKSGVLRMTLPDSTSANNRMAVISFGWRSQTAITQVTLDSTSHFLTGSSLTVYGTQ